MKVFMTQSLVKNLAIAMLGCAVAVASTARAADDPPAEPPQNSGTETNSDEQQQAVGELIQSVIEAQQANGENQPPGEGENGKTNESRASRPIRGQGTRGSAGSGTNAISLTTLVAKNSTNHTANATNMLRLNFRNAPLSMVLDYLSEAAGFTISPSSKVDLHGSVTVWSNQPVTREQAVALLHKALSEYNYAATVEGNILNIYVIDSSNTEIVAGVPDNDYTKVTPSKDLVTQIVYVHNVEAAQLITSLQPLMPSGTSMNANQGANAIVITDSKASIRRMVQLVKALDTASVGATEVRVFPLDYADATALAQVVMQLFPDSSSSSSRDRSRFGGFPFGGFGGDRGSSSSSSSSSSQAGRMAAGKVTAVADDRSNSLVVSAPQDQMEYLEKLIKEMDVNVDDVTELRVFRLRYADPQETADQLTTLFPDPTQQNSNDRSRYRGFGFFPGFSSDRSSRSSSSSTDANSRKVRAARVQAVPDPRTGSVIVSAARDLMGQISSIIEELDSDPAKKKKVYVIKVENRDPAEVVEDLQAVIASDSSSGNLNNSRSSSRQSGSQLNTRQQNNLQNSGNNNNSSFLGNGNSRSSSLGR